jgi:23S rRNA (pseudouridine1915-N3)-methyltransferase
MKLHIITVGSPKLAYAQAGWQEYIKRLGHYHTVRVTHIADKHNDHAHLLQAAGNAYKVGLAIEGKELNSLELAAFLEQRAIEGREICFLVGGPDGLLTDTINACDFIWSFGKLTYPHDLAMVMLGESLYRASTISAGTPYHH